MDHRRAIFIGKFGEIAEAERKALVGILSKGKTRGTVAQAVDGAAAFANGAFAAIRAKHPSTRRVACQAGCSYCCILQVHVTAPEVLRIADHIRETRTPEEVAELKARVAEVDARTRGMVALERFFARIPCPLLRDGKCSVYPARPLPCRGYTSYSWVACIRAFRMQKPEKAQPLGGLQVDVYAAVQDGVLAGLDDVGLRPQLLELIAALRIALDIPDAAERWLAGEPIFTPALLPSTEKAASLNRPRARGDVPAPERGTTRGTSRRGTPPGGPPLAQEQNP